MPKKAEPLRISYSAVQTWRDCQQRYSYTYIDKLQPKVREAAPELGTMLHDYLDRYYRKFIGRSQVTTDTDIERAHIIALRRSIIAKRDEVRSLAGIAESVGSEDTARALLAIPATAEALAVAYHRVVGARDARTHKIIMSETDFELEARPGVVLPGKIDLVTRNKQGFWLWEHKSTGSIPERGRRFRDLQVLIYAVALDELFGIKIAGVIWNYIQTTPPHEPALLKSGIMSTAKQVTTVELVRRAIKRHGLDAGEYAPFLRDVERRERTSMFVRYTQPIVQVENVLLRDYLTSADEIETFRRGDVPAVRNIAPHCDWCFTTGTRITMADGSYKPVQNVKEGDRLLARSRGGLVGTTVIATSGRLVDAVLQIKAGNRVVYVTPEHPFLVKGRWKRARRLVVGDEIVELTGTDIRQVMMRERNPMSRPEVALNKRNGRAPGFTCSEIHKRRVAKAKLANGSAQAWRGRLAVHKQWPRERAFDAAFTAAALPIQYIGDGRLWIGKRNPDFKVNGQKKVIEISTNQYKAARRSDLERHGYKVLVLQGRKPPISYLESVWDFVHNGAKVTSICTIRAAQWSRRFGGRAIKVYNLQCSPHANYFGNMLLSHNCPMLKLCQAAVTGGGDRSIRRMYYEEREARG